MFSVKAFSEEPNIKEADQTEHPNIPLIVVKNQGSCYNHSLLPSKLLIDDDKAFASNYAKPELVFSHFEGKRIHVHKVTVRTPFSSLTGAYPLGEGMIFLSDTL